MSETSELRQKLRMIISHASGGYLSEPGDINRSTNDICVEISRHKNDIWEQAQESARAAHSEAKLASAGEAGTATDSAAGVAEGEHATAAQAAGRPTTVTVAQGEEEI